MLSFLSFQPVVWGGRIYCWHQVKVIPKTASTGMPAMLNRYLISYVQVLGSRRVIFNTSKDHQPHKFPLYIQILTFISCKREVKICKINLDFVSKCFSFSILLDVISQIGEKPPDSKGGSSQRENMHEMLMFLFDGHFK